MVHGVDAVHLFNCRDKCRGNMSFYWLTHDVHICISSGNVIWFDVTRDKFYGTKAEDAVQLGATVKGWPTSNSDEPERPVVTSEQAQEIARVLEERGLLTANPACGVPVVLAVLEKAQTTLDDVLPKYRTRLRLIHFMRFVRAWIETKLALRCHSLSYALRTTAARKAHNNHSWCDSDAAELVTEFKRIRRYFYTVRLACLFDSLVLARFLSMYGIFPALVFGVKTGPFGAHCWIQHHGVVWNGDADYVERFVPIHVI
jgi:hypothetical protein